MQNVDSKDASAALTAGIGNGKTAQLFLGIKARKKKVVLQRYVAVTTSEFSISFVEMLGH